MYVDNIWDLVLYQMQPESTLQHYKSPQTYPVQFYLGLVFLHSLGKPILQILVIWYLSRSFASYREKLQSYFPHTFTTHLMRLTKYPLLFVDTWSDLDLMSYTELRATLPRWAFAFSAQSLETFYFPILLKLLRHSPPKPALLQPALS